MGSNMLSLVRNFYVGDVDPFLSGPGLGYVFNAISWILGFLVGCAVIVTGVAADRGHKWAAGNRAYRPIRG